MKSIVQLASTAVGHLPPAVSEDCYVDLRNKIAKMCSVKYIIIITLTDHEQAYRMVLHLPFSESAYSGLRKCRHKHTETILTCSNEHQILIGRLSEK